MEDFTQRTDRYNEKTKIKNPQHDKVQPSPKKSWYKKHLMALISSITFIIILLIGIIAIYYSLKNKKKYYEYRPITLASGEVIVANISRKVNEISTYKENKIIKSNIKAGNDTKTREESIITEFIFNIYNSTKEEDNTNLTYGYIAITNMTKTDENGTQYIGGLGINNMTDSDESLRYLEENDVSIDDYSIPLISVSFYENGTTKDIYHPVNISEYMFTALKDLANKIIPTVSEKLYQKNRTRLLEESTNETYREVNIDNSSIILVEEVNKQAEVDQIVINNSTIKGKTNTTIDGEENYIKSITSTSNTSFASHQNNQLDNIEAVPDNLISEDDIITNDENIIPSQIEALSSTIDSNISFISKSINETLTNRIKHLTKNLTFVSMSKSPQGNSTLRLLRSLNLTEDDIYTGPIPEYAIKRRLDSNLIKPILLNYPIFKHNLLGLQSLMTVVVDAGTDKDETSCSLLFSLGSITFKLANYNAQTLLGMKLEKIYETNRDMADLINELIDNVDDEIQTWKNKANDIINSVVNDMSNINNITDELKEISKEISEKMNNKIRISFLDFPQAVIKLNDTITNKIDLNDTALIDGIKEIYTKYQEKSFEAFKQFHKNTLLLIDEIEQLIKNGVTEEDKLIIKETLDTVYKQYKEYNSGKDVFDKIQNFFDSIVTNFESQEIHDKIKTIVSNLKTYEQLKNAFKDKTKVLTTFDNYKKNTEEILISLKRKIENDILAKKEQYDVDTYINEFDSKYKLLNESIQNNAEGVVSTELKSVIEKINELLVVFKNESTFQLENVYNFVSPFINTINNQLMLIGDVYDNIIIKIKTEINNISNEVIQNIISVLNKHVIKSSQLDEVYSDIHNFILSKVNNFDYLIKNKIRRRLLRRNKEKTHRLRNTLLTSEIIADKLNDLQNKFNTLSRLIEQDNNNKLTNSFNLYSSLTNNISSPFEDIVKQCSFIDGTNVLKNHTDSLSFYLEEYLSEVSSNISNIKNEFYNNTMYNSIISESKEITYSSLNSLIKAIAAELNLVQFSDEKMFPRKVLGKFAINVFGIQFNFDLGIQFKFKYGIHLSISVLKNNSAIYLKLTGGASLTLEGRAYITILASDFGAGIFVTTEGEIGIIPSIKINELKAGITHYVKLTPFTVGVHVFVTIFWISIKWVHVLWFDIPIPSFERRTFIFGELKYSGPKYEVSHYKESSLI